MVGLVDVACAPASGIVGVDQVVVESGVCHIAVISQDIHRVQVQIKRIRSKRSLHRIIVVVFLNMGVFGKQTCCKSLSFIM